MSGSNVNVLLIGGGGREHALARRLKASRRLGTLWVTHPQNPGLAALGRAVDVPVNIREIYRLQMFCEKQDIGLVVVGPEDPLSEGFADALAAPNRVVFGPTRAGAQIEADKAWAKDLMRMGSIPTAESRSFTDAGGAISYIESRLGDEPAVGAMLARVGQARTAERRRDLLNAALAVGAASAQRQAPPAADLRLLMQTFFRDEPALEFEQRKMLSDCAEFHREYVKERADLPVIKASGLAKGKGVILPGSLAEAAEAIRQVMVKRIFGDAGKTVVIEERLSGPEVSVLALVDGRTILVLPVCQDHKRLLDGDKGPNTGGMGAYCPADVIDDATLGRVEREILVPTVDSLRREGIEYRGVLYAGLMLTHSGPKVLEFNCRFGDPECQPLMARLTSDALDLFEATARGRLDEVEVTWDDRAACCVVLASEGYPEKPRSGVPIEGLQGAEAMERVVVDHAGTAIDAAGRLVTAGGRVLGVTGLGHGVAEARARAYQAVERIKFAGMQYRGDIAESAVKPAHPGVRDR